MCANQGAEDSGWGVRFLQGAYADVFLWRSGVVRGYAVAICRSTSSTRIGSRKTASRPTRWPCERSWARRNPSA
jgi:hypothetical protein